MAIKALIDGRSYLLENLYPFLFFSSSKIENGWLYIVCREYGQGDESKVLSKVNILTEHSMHMKNPKSTQRQSRNV